MYKFNADYWSKDEINRIKLAIEKHLIEMFETESIYVREDEVEMFNIILKSFHYNDYPVLKNDYAYQLVEDSLELYDLEMYEKYENWDIYAKGVYIY